MRRIMSACLLQTVRFDTLNDTKPAEDLEIYCKKLERKGTKYEIVEQNTETDGTIIVKIKKQYNAYKVTGYID